MSNVISLVEYRERKELEKIDPSILFKEACTLSDADETSEEAAQLYEKVIKIDPTAAHAITNLGNIYFAQGNGEKAKTQWIRAVEIDPTITAAHYNLGYLYLTQSSFKHAISSFLKCLAIDPNFSDAHFNLAEAYFFLKKKKLGREHYAKYTELEPQGPWAQLAKDRIQQMQQ